ncbi:MAG: hypothetical protein GYB53_21625 [Rhodobacteraceae bacterium]|nr:hypothetical protein [Paracoccaceae bacterium]MBR9819678.1 hypothetical protein [Paracoccaceae bacterium]
MTWFGRQGAEVAPNDPLVGGLPSWTERVELQYRIDRRTTDSFGKQKAEFEHDLLTEMQEAIGPDTPIRTRTRSSDKRFRLERDQAAARVAELRGFEPATFDRLPASAEEFDAEVERRRRAEFEEFMELQGNAPEGAWFPELVGSLGAGARDEYTLLTLPLGGFSGAGAKLGFGALAARTALSEGAAGALGEYVSLPDQREAALDLGLPAPEAAKQVATAAALSAGLGVAGAGIAHGLTRGADYLRTRGEARAEQLRQDDRALDHMVGVEQAAAELADRRMAAEAARQEGQGVANPGQPLAMSDFDFSPAGNASPRDNRIGYVFGRLLERGMQPHIAAGWIGNFMAESGPGLDPFALGDNGNAFGIAQWNGPRKRALEAFAQARGKPASDLDTQIDFLFHELETSEAGAWAQIQGARTAAEAAELVSTKFERPGIPALPRRRGHAVEVMNQYQGGEVPRWRGASTPVGGQGAAAGSAPTTYQTSRPYTRSGEVSVGDGMRVEVEYQVVDLSTLRQASGDLQPRDRSRATSDAWVAETAANLDPARLMDGPEADRGAPLVGPDNVIESGNGRARAIERAYELGYDRAQAYRRQIEARTGQPIPEGIERPVLIARRTSELDPDARRRLVVEAQDSGVARMNATERAGIGQRALTHDALEAYDPKAELGSARNRDFARAFIGNFPRSERNAFLSAEGRISSDGIRQLRDALFARAFPDPDILARYVEAERGELRSLMDAMAEAAPDLARLRAAIDADVVAAEFDITPFVIDAARLIMLARETAAETGAGVAGVLEDLLADVDLFLGDRVAPLTRALVRKFMPGGRQASKGAIADFLTRYAREAMVIGRTGGDLVDRATPADALRRIDPDTFGDLDELGEPAPRAAPVGDAPDLRTMPDGAYDQGAASREAAASDLQAERDLRDVVAAAARDDATGGAALSEQDVADADLRAEIESFRQSGLDLSYEDANGTRISLQQVLDDLDADEALELTLDACPTGRGL